jgi:uncharacterized protein (TIGR02391 family)
VNANYRLIANELGDLIKGDTPVNEIDRAGRALLQIGKTSFPNPAITSVRAKAVHDWVLSLARVETLPEERDQRLVVFCEKITPTDKVTQLQDILQRGGVGRSAIDRTRWGLFDARGFQTEVVRHSRKLFVQGNYFHAVFEAAKAYNKAVKDKTHTNKDGCSLMMDVWGCDKGVLKVTNCESDTDKNVQDGIKFLSAGLMQAIRNPTAHEPALHWPIAEEDCLDILHFISFLFRKLDKAVFVPKQSP